MMASVWISPDLKTDTLERQVLKALEKATGKNLRHTAAWHSEPCTDNG